MASHSHLGKDTSPPRSQLCSLATWRFKLLSNNMKLGALLNLSVTQFPHIWNVGHNSIYLFGLLWRLNEFIDIKLLKIVPGTEYAPSGISHYHYLAPLPLTPCAPVPWTYQSFSHHRAFECAILHASLEWLNSHVLLHLPYPTDLIGLSWNVTSSGSNLTPKAVPISLVT